MDLGITDRAYVVTGGTSGLGLATARALVAEGAHVLVVSRSADHVDDAVAALGERAAGVVGDLAEADLGRRLVTDCRARFGRCDGGFVSYGGPPPGGARELDDDDLDRSVARGLVEPVRMVRDLVRHADDAAAVVLLASSSVEQPIPGLAGSNLTRPGLWGYVKTLADEVAPVGRRVNLVVPGSFATPRLDELFRSRSEQSGRTVDEERAAAASTVPLGRLGDPDELGRVAALLLSPVTSFVTGAAWRVDGGAIRGL